MANIFSFTKKTNDTPGSWTNQIISDSPLGFSSSNISMSSTLNETYTTAIDNETHYLSVLDSPENDETLEDIHNITLNHQKLTLEDNELQSDNEPENNFALTENYEQQVEIFTIEGTDEVYGIQTAQDEEGNVHRYQFQFRKTDDGQLEAIPETVQILPNEQPEPNAETSNDLPEYDNHIIRDNFESQVYLEENTEETDNEHILLSKDIENAEKTLENVYGRGKRLCSNNSLISYMKGEPIQDKDLQEGQLEQEYLSENIKIEAETVPVKHEYLNSKFRKELQEHEVENLLTSNEDETFESLHAHEDCPSEGDETITIKHEYINSNFDQELQEHEVENLLSSNEDATFENLHEHEDCPSEDGSYSGVEIPNEMEGTIIAYHTLDSTVTAEESDTGNNNPDPTNNDRYDQLFVEEGNLNGLQYEDGHQEQTSNTENMLIVESEGRIHGSDLEDFEIVEGLPVTADGEISEDTSSTIYHEQGLLTERDLAGQGFPIKEKTVQRITNILKPPRIDKSDTKKKTILYYMIPNTDQKENLHSLSNPRSLLKNNQVNDERQKRIQREKMLERRYARSKEAMQAKIFNNFINKTTILHAPIRTTRSPRKQEIKPVDARRDEEIIVQEVLISSKGFEENSVERLKKLDTLAVTSIVELSDSDENSESQNDMKKNKKRKNKKSATSIYHEDTDVIEILQSDDESEDINNTTNNNLEKAKDDIIEIVENAKSVTVDINTQSSPQSNKCEETESGKQEITCPDCPKTFPNQSSLSTHIQHHKLENNVIKKKTAFNGGKYKCDKCQESFKNNVLLTRHLCKFNTSKHKCVFCSKFFDTVALLNNHKKIHMKENLFKNTSMITISPRKFLPRRSSTVRLSTNVNSSFKCKECSKTFSTQSILSAHEKSHKKIVCIRCNLTFPSKLLLESHIRTSCVKNTSPKSKRLSFKIPKPIVGSALNSPKKSKNVKESKESQISTTSRPTIPNCSRKSTIPNSSRKSTIPNSSRKSTITNSSKRSIIPRSQSNLSARQSIVPCNQSKKSGITRSQSNSAIITGSKGNSTCVKNSMTVKNDKAELKTEKTIEKNINKPHVPDTSTIKTLGCSIKCDSCSKQFGSFTALFKHNVRDHGVSTPDKKVLEPKRKTLYKPLNVHGGMRHEGYSKAFQQVREKVLQHLGPAKATEQ